MSDNSKKVAFETKIEREVHRFVSEINEHVYDFTHLYFMKHRETINKDTLERVLEIVKMGQQDGLMGKFDKFKENIRKELDAFAATKNPTKKQSNQEGE